MPGAPRRAAIRSAAGGDRRNDWLRDVPGFQPAHFVEDGRLYGLGISNMKGALACYLAALDALGEEELTGDIVVAAECHDGCRGRDDLDRHGTGRRAAAVEKIPCVIRAFRRIPQWSMPSVRSRDGVHTCPPHYPLLGRERTGFVNEA